MGEVTMEKNICARLYKKNDLRLETAQIVEPGLGEVQVRMAYVGICGSDIHFLDEGQIDQFIVTQPVIPGHEMSGVINKIGPGVTSLKVGDHVAIDPNRPCHQCRLCLMGRTNLCDQLTIAGIPHTNGGLCQYMVSPAANCHKLPDNISLEAGACMEPLSIGLRGLKRSQLQPGDLVVVLGAGTIGLLTMQTAKTFGAKKVVITDVKPERLEMARRLGADDVFKVESSDPKVTAAAIKHLLGTEADLCIECSGAPGTVDTAIFTCRPGGTVLMLGVGQLVLTTHLGMAALREINIVGSVCNCSDLPESISLTASGQVDVMPIVTHIIPLNEIGRAFDLAREGNTSIKVLIDCQMTDGIIT